MKTTPFFAQSGAWRGEAIWTEREPQDHNLSAVFTEESGQRVGEAWRADR